MHTGRCLCGAIRFQFETDPVFSGKCHCRDCQYVSGGEPAAVIVVLRASLTIDGQEPREFRSTADSGAEVFRSFCPECGTPLFAGNADSPETIAVKAGALDDPSLFTDQFRIWTSSAQTWHHIDESIDRYEKDPQ